MNGSTMLKIELGIDAQKIMQAVIFHNEIIEDEIRKGIDLAIKELSNGDNFALWIKEAVKDELQNTVHKAIMSYEIKMAIHKSIAEKIGLKIGEFADNYAETISKSLNEIKP